jgi:hypothetical protein
VLERPLSFIDRGRGKGGLEQLKGRHEGGLREAEEASPRNRQVSRTAAFRVRGEGKCWGFWADSMAANGDSLAPRSQERVT